MRILYVSTIGSFMNFFKYSIEFLKEKNITVDFACNTSNSPVNEELTRYNNKVHSLNLERNPFRFSNYAAINELKRIIKESEYNIVHCHTAVAGVVTRLACVGMRKKGVKVLYTPHGLNFSKESSWKNWLFYFPIEVIASLLCDGIIGMNKEEFSIMRKYLFCKNKFFIHGVGIDLKIYSKGELRKEIREAMGISDSVIVLISVGELSERKNHEVAIKALAHLSGDFKYLIVGEGPLKKKLQEIAKITRVEEKVEFLGFRKDIPALLSAADIFVFPSLLEGLPVSLMEAMASNLPCVVSNISGNADLIDQGKGGYLIEKNDVNKFSKLIGKLSNNKTQRELMGIYNRKKIENYSYQNVNQELFSIYEKVLEN